MVVNGETYHPHEGESIWLLPPDQVADALELAKIARYKIRVEAAEGEPDAEIQAAAILGDLIDDFVGYLAPRVTRWTLTDRRGEPLAQPGGDPFKVRAIDKTLLMWIFGRLQIAETPAERKNGSRPSPITSSATSSPTPTA